MKRATAQSLRCPRCGAQRSFDLEADEETEREVREGRLTCRGCAQRYEISEGIVDLLFEAPEFVTREAAGLDRFADVMRRDGWDRERILALPDVELGYWYAQGQEMRAILDRVDFSPGQTLVDVGSNTCWASNIFARRGLDVLAVDIARAEMQGLRTAEYFFEDSGVYFDRLLSVMFDLALADESVDYVFCCEVLHHNDRRNLRRTLAEAHRVLRPGGRLIVNNEPLRFPFRLKLDHAEEVAEFEGYEHVYFFHEYYLAARAAGFDIALREPAGGSFGPWVAKLGPDTSPAAATRAFISHLLRRQRWGRGLRYAYKTLLVGDVSLNFLATKR